MQAFDTHSAALVATDLTGGGTVGFSGSFETMDYPTSTMVFVGINTRRGPCRDTVLCQALQRLADLGYCTALYCTLAGFAISVLAGHALVSPAVSTFMLLTGMQLWALTQEQNGQPKLKKA